MTTALVKQDNPPVWLADAVTDVLKRTRVDGYGVVIPHYELDELLQLPQLPSGVVTKKEIQTFQFKRFARIEMLRTDLLTNHCLYLMNVRGDGYEVLHPMDQVKIAPDKHVREARHAIGRAIGAATHVRTEEIDAETEALRTQKMARLQFIQTAFNKRKFPLPDETKGIK